MKARMRVWLGAATVVAVSVLATVPAFAQDPDTVWVRRCNGPGDSTDIPEAIAVDHLGNVYVTGQSFGGLTLEDYLTIKYYPNGDTAWVRRYNSPYDTTDIVLDGAVCTLMLKILAFAPIWHIFPRDKIMVTGHSLSGRATLAIHHHDGLWSVGSGLGEEPWSQRRDSHAYCNRGVGGSAALYGERFRRLADGD